VLGSSTAFAGFLRFLPPVQQHELLFVCELNQLLASTAEGAGANGMAQEEERPESEIVAIAIKVANIFLRDAPAPNHTSPPSSSAEADAHASAVRVMSISPATRRQLLAIIPLTMPPHLLPRGGSKSRSTSLSLDRDFGSGGSSPSKSRRPWRATIRPVDHAESPHGRERRSRRESLRRLLAEIPGCTDA
jgi:hypothetical protein